MMTVMNMKVTQTCFSSIFKEGWQSGWKTKWFTTLLPQWCDCCTTSVNLRTQFQDHNIDLQCEQISVIIWSFATWTMTGEWPVIPHFHPSFTLRLAPTNLTPWTLVDEPWHALSNLFLLHFEELLGKTPSLLLVTVTPCCLRSMSQDNFRLDKQPCWPPFSGVV